MQSPSRKISAPAKINLFLSVIGKRADGYHELETVMQKVKLADQLTLRPCSGGISLKCLNCNLPEDENNLAFKAAQFFLARTGVKSGVKIELEKNIPVAAGLGGGSSDAAAVLNGLNDFFEGPLADQELLDLAVKIGADVPFFVAGHKAALATGIGEKMSGLEPMSPCWLLLVNPGIAVSTSWVFDNLSLTSAENPYMLSCLKSSGGKAAQGNPLVPDINDFLHYFNHLESVTIPRYSVINDIKEQLMRCGAQTALMSGSGATVFAVFDQLDKAGECCELFRGRYKEVYLTEPL